MAGSNSANSSFPSNKEEQQKKKKQDEADKVNRKKDKEAKAEEKQRVALSALETIVPKRHELGDTHLKALTVPLLKDLILYHFKPDTGKVQGLVRKDILAIAARLYTEASQSNNTAAVAL